jgi:nitrile hydratase accessory protein
VTQVLPPELATTLPRDNGELVFDAPWQGRVLAMAVALVREMGLEWDDFRRRLIAAIEEEPGRAYYESWLAALESLVASAVPEHRYEAGMGELEIFALPTDEATLLALITELFENWWQDIRFGPLVQGAVWEGRAFAPPESITMLDGYVTVEMHGWHFHLCIGEHRGAEPEVARVRRCHRAELYRVLHDGAPVSWGLRMFNGAGEQQMTVLLPNPFLDDEQRTRATPDWTRLACWDLLRRRFVGLGPDPTDRTALAFHHA